jgi:hypothetical protein
MAPTDSQRLTGAFWRLAAIYKRGAKALSETLPGSLAGKFRQRAHCLWLTYGWPGPHGSSRPSGRVSTRPAGQAVVEGRAAVRDGAS